jgi:hypothetical protein
MGIVDKIHQEELEFIRLENFMEVLNFSLSGSEIDGFYLLPKLLDKGLSLRYTESGYFFDEQMAHKGEVKHALIKVSRGIASWNQVLETQNGLEVSLGNLLVKRADVEKVFFEYGETRFPWVLTLLPKSSDDWDWVTIGMGNAGVGSQGDTDPASIKAVQDNTISKKRDQTKWLHETWIKEGKPEGSDFFDSLKKYVNKKDSPIVEHYTVSQWGAGIQYNNGKATAKRMTKKAIQNNVSKFKEEP